jgi:hypothetical protein
MMPTKAGLALAWDTFSCFFQDLNGFLNGFVFSCFFLFFLLFFFLFSLRPVFSMVREHRAPYTPLTSSCSIGKKPCGQPRHAGAGELDSIGIGEWVSSGQSTEYPAAPPFNSTGILITDCHSRSQTTTLSLTFYVQLRSMFEPLILHDQQASFFHLVSFYA